MHRMACALARILGPDAATQEVAQKLAHRVGDINSATNAWERRILELGDGKRVTDIVEILFREESRSGAWVVDIGLWKSLFDWRVLETVADLALRGHVRLRDDDDR